MEMRRPDWTLTRLGLRLLYAGGATAVILGLGSVDAIFSLVQADDVDGDGVADDLGIDWVYDPDTGLMVAEISFDDAYLVDSNGDAIMDPDDGTLITLEEYLNATDDTADVYNGGYTASDGDTWTFTYIDNNGGNYQARFVEIDITFDDPGDLGITVAGTEGVDVIYGTDAGDSLTGLGGNDQFFGLGGNDTINGGSGADTVDGGSGSNVIVPDVIDPDSPFTVPDVDTYTMDQLFDVMTMTGWLDTI